MAQSLGMIEPFALERYYAKHEFTTKYMLSSSDPESYSMSELLELADEKDSELWNNLSLGYTESQGLPQLREEIAARFYSKCKPEDLILCAPQEGILLAMNTIVQKGDCVLCTFPGYQSLHSITRAMGCKVVPWKASPPRPAGNVWEQSGWSFSMQRVKKAFADYGEKLKLIVFNFPHNPTGAHPPPEFLKELVGFARKHKIFLFSDEMYRLLEHDPRDRLPSASDLSANAISLFGLSKTFGMPGLRVGWLYTRNEEMMNRLKQVKDYTTICSSAPSEILALIAVKAADQIIKRTLAIVQDNLSLLDDFFKRYSAVFIWVRPRAGTMCFPRFRDDFISASEFCNDVRKKQSVLLLPSTQYGFGDKHIRMGVGRANFPEALEKLEKYMQGAWIKFRAKQQANTDEDFQGTKGEVRGPRLWAQDDIDPAMKQQVAAEYIQLINERFGAGSDVIKEYVLLLKAFQKKKLDTFAVIQKVKTLFHGHDDVIMGFNVFLPANTQIRFPSVIPDFQTLAIEGGELDQAKSRASAQLQTGDSPAAVNFDDCINYVNKVRKRFTNDPETYQEFLGVLQSYQQDRNVPKVCDEVRMIFENHPDLLQEFTIYLPEGTEI